MPARVFVSYSRQDVLYKDKVLQQLRVLERQGLVATWSDDRISPGSDWHKELTEQLDGASIVVLLITANFLTSDFILNEEVPRAFEKRREAGLQIIPVLCRPCAWDMVDWLNQLAMWPAGAQPLWVKEDDDPEQLLSDLAREIARISGKPIKPTTTKGESLDRVILDQRLMGIEAQHGLGLAGIAEIVRATIARGAPLYNNGDHEACAVIYRHTITFILPRLISMLETDRDKSTLSRRGLPSARREMGAQDELRLRPMDEREQIRRESNIASMIRSIETSNEMIMAIVKELTAVRDYVTIESSSAANVAWRIRHTFDRLLILARAIQLIPQLEYHPIEGSPFATASSRQTIMEVLRSIDEIADQCGIDSDDDYEVGASTSATLGFITSRFVAEYLGLTRPQNALEDKSELLRHFEQLTLENEPLSQPYRMLYHSRHFLRAVLSKRDLRGEK